MRLHGRKPRLPSPGLLRSQTLHVNVIQESVAIGFPLRPNVCLIRSPSYLALCHRTRFTFGTKQQTKPSTVSSGLNPPQNRFRAFGRRFPLRPLTFRYQTRYIIYTKAHLYTVFSFRQSDAICRNSWCLWSILALLSCTRRRGERFVLLTVHLEPSFALVFTFLGIQALKFGSQYLFSL